MEPEPLDPQVQLDIYRTTAESGRPPRAAEVAGRLGCDRGEVLAAFRRLNGRRLLALAPETGEVVMAPPFSAVPTPFLVRAGGRSYFANCVWDALGIAAALHQDADVEASCACCGEPMALRVRGGAPEPEPCVAHFAVPAKQWWDDITYT
ncbi:MAG TPA: organomercurial lyase [Thermoanaerobaculia bacterium]|nr:organomercurial lyase [Thermoanaerobaculia bacterium]